MNEQTDFSVFPYAAINQKLGIEPSFSDTEITNLLSTAYGSKYSYLILSLLYPDRDWNDRVYHEDHIFPKSSFTARSLAIRNYSAEQIEKYQRHFNTILNLQLLTDTENLAKNATPFDNWFPTRDDNFRIRHSLPAMTSYDFDHFLEFIEKRRAEIAAKLRKISM
jgi:hypothetical protein